MASYGELVLVTGDFHIPHRCSEVAERFRKILGPNKMQHVLCTGNVTTREQQDFLRTLAPRMHQVRGDFDEDDTLPETKVVTIGTWKIGLCHGHQYVPAGEAEALAALARQLDVDMVVTGATHRHSIVEYEGKVYINPGSMTGAFNPTAAVGEVRPTFVLMNLKEATAEYFVYELQAGGKLAISQSVFHKGGKSGVVAGGASTTAPGAGTTSAGGAGGGEGGLLATTSVPTPTGGMGLSTASYTAAGGVVGDSAL